ncbi:MAG: TaqI-like C-terminal specificity domain-containing protein [Pseudomonadota bacterium]
MTHFFDTAFATVKQLAADFRAGESHFLLPEYSEAAARKDFIDKFWTALGWDVDHIQQRNPYEQEVKVERSVTDRASKRRADYAFYLAPNYRDPRFFVEAKKPSRQIENDDDYFQAIRYGWNTGTPLVVLTDFEQFHVLDCRYRPDIKTAIHQAVYKFRYEDYENREKFEQIYWLFSREAVAADSLTKRVADLPKRKGKQLQRGLLKTGAQGIDEAFLEELDGYRETLAKAYKKHNEDLDGETLTELVQRTVDRLVFLRFLEDKLIETKIRVADFGNGGSVWKDFIAASRKLDGIYNGIVFKQHKLLDDPSFAVDEEAFSDICDELAHDQSPYDFNYIPIHILGSIYERFLGKVITTSDKRAKVEEKPEVRKAGGVYYTPDYIVQYIVAQTIGKLIEGKTPAQIAELRFADIACGSGSFLLGVFDCLLRYHRDWYNANPDKASGVVGRKGRVPEVYKHEDGGLRLTLAKKSEILLNNIYGVDLDQQATEVAQLSLYLKLLEEETPGSARGYLEGFGGALLPTLNKNIVCGNSLIGTDILDGQLFDPVEERKLNPMNFETAFPEVMKRGGFDAIVGNPPWGSLFSDRETHYLTTRYVNSKGEAESHLFFIERALRFIKDVGALGYITPNTWLAVIRSKEIREHLLSNARFLEVVQLSKYIFKDAPDIVPALVFLSKTQKGKLPCVVKTTKLIKVGAANFDTAFDIKQIDQDIWLKTRGATINLALDESVLSVIRRCQTNTSKLQTVCEVVYGIKTSDNAKFLSKEKTSTHSVKALKTGELSRFHLQWKHFYLWWSNQLAGYRSSNVEVPKIVVQYIRKLSLPRRIIAALDERGEYYPLNNYSYITLSADNYSLKYVLGIMNSKLMNFYYANTFIDYNIKPTYLQSLPIRTLEFSKGEDRAVHEKLSRFVEQMLDAKQKFGGATNEKDQNYWQGRCEDLDRKIDALVYELYGLTEDEIRIVEAAPA